MPNVSFLELNNLLVIKQKALSLKRLERPEARRKKEEAKREFKRIEGYLKNLVRASNPEYTDGRVMDCVNENKEYQEAWAVEIVCQSAYDKVNVEIDNLEDELDTVKEMSHNLKREADVSKIG